MDLKNSTEKLKYDTRLTERNLKNGSLNKEELDKHLKGLPDLSSQSEGINLEGATNGADLDETELVQ